MFGAAMGTHDLWSSRLTWACMISALLILALGAVSARAQITFSEEAVPGLGDYPLKPSQGPASGASYEIIGTSSFAPVPQGFNSGNAQATLQSGSGNTSVQAISGALNQTSSYQFGFDNSVLNGAIGTVASGVYTLQYGAQHEATSLIVGGVGNRTETLQIGTQNAGQILVYGSSHTNVGLVQAGSHLSRSIAVIGSPGVNVLVIQR
jgi:hypothetical protein